MFHIREASESIARSIGLQDRLVRTYSLQHRPLQCLQSHPLEKPLEPPQTNCTVAQHQTRNITSGVVSV